MMARFIILIAVLALLDIALPKPSFAYIDPGAGSYIFQVIVAFLLGILFSVKVFWVKIKSFFKNILDKTAKRD